MRISVSVEINAPREKVFPWLGDPERAMTWMTSVAGGEIIEQTPDMVGTTFRERVEEDGRGTELHGVITEWVPDERLAFHLEGEFNDADVLFTLEEVGSATRVTQTAEVRFKGVVRIMSLFFGQSFKRNIRRQAESEFAALKALCEAEAARA